VKLSVYGVTNILIHQSILLGVLRELKLMKHMLTSLNNSVLELEAVVGFTGFAPGPHWWCWGL
jgi:hypothetical protein